MSDENKFIEGLYVKPPHGKAPDFVKASISFKRKDLGNWLRGRAEEWINIDVKEAKNGNWYASVNDWKPEEKKPTQNNDDDFNDDLPF